MKETTGVSCGCGLAVLAFNLLIGAWTFSYDLWDIAGKQVPWYINVLCGAIGGEVTVPLAFILWVLSFFGIHGPWIH